MSLYFEWEAEKMSTKLPAKMIRELREIIQAANHAIGLMRAEKRSSAAIALNGQCQWSIDSAVLLLQAEGWLVLQEFSAGNHSLKIVDPTVPVWRRWLDRFR